MTERRTGPSTAVIAVGVVATLALVLALWAVLRGDDNDSTAGAPAPDTIESTDEEADLVVDAVDALEEDLLAPAAPIEAANSARRMTPRVYVDEQPIIAGVPRCLHSSTVARATA